jgi:hypothetical protein
LKKVEFLLIQLEGFLYLNYPSLLDFFNEALEDVNEIIADDDLRLFYKWRNGSKISSVNNLGKNQFCSFGYLLPLDDADRYQKNFNEENYFNNKNYFPFLASLGGDFLLIDKTKRKSGIFLYSPNLLVNEPLVIYNDIDCFLETVYECFNQRAYKYDTEFYLEVNDDLEKKYLRNLMTSLNFGTIKISVDKSLHRNDF